MLLLHQRGLWAQACKSLSSTQLPGIKGEQLGVQTVFPGRNDDAVTVTGYFRVQNLRSPSSMPFSEQTWYGPKLVWISPCIEVYSKQEQTSKPRPVVQEVPWNEANARPGLWRVSSEQRGRRRPEPWWPLAGSTVLICTSCIIIQITQHVTKER
ncbi:Kinesin-Like Protein Kif18A [Manis pentadactyla]|nr:Kinesin-Like Protein Kif18A [Manis pentadactyla]